MDPSACKQKILEFWNDIEAKNGSITSEEFLQEHDYFYKRCMENFANMKVISVARDRFAPVKNCSDLLVRRSDACLLRETDKALILHPERKHIEPVVRLDENYKKLGDFEKLCPVIPSLAAAELLTVKGAVMFDARIRIEGKVTIENKSGAPLSVSKIGRELLKDETVTLEA